MSNTSTVTPYDSSSSSGLTDAAGLAAAACFGGLITLGRWLSEESAEDRDALDRFKGERRRELLGTDRIAEEEILSRQTRESLGITTVGLQLRNPESLIRTAEKLGYRMESLAQPSTSISSQPQILLRRASGERLAISRNERGRLDVSTAGDRIRVQELVRQHTVERATEHLTRKGMSVRTAALPSGEVQILAHEQDSTRRGGAAEVKTQVHADGTVVIDVDKVQGNRCEEIVKEFAEAVGGQVSGMAKKNSYFQLPGEPTKTEVKV